MTISFEPETKSARRPFRHRAHARSTIAGRPPEAARAGRRPTPDDRGRTNPRSSKRKKRDEERGRRNRRAAAQPHAQQPQGEGGGRRRRRRRRRGGRDRDRNAATMQEAIPPTAGPARLSTARKTAMWNSAHRAEQAQHQPQRADARSRRSAARRRRRRGRRGRGRDGEQSTASGDAPHRFPARAKLTKPMRRNRRRRSRRRRPPAVLPNAPSTPSWSLTERAAPARRAEARRRGRATAKSRSRAKTPDPRR